jgi:hypothetical protein
MGATRRTKRHRRHPQRRAVARTDPDSNRYAARPRRAAARSWALRPPHTPASAGLCATDHARHSSRTRHPAHTRLAGRASFPSSGNQLSSGCSRQAASACHAGRPISTSNRSRARSSATLLDSTMEQGRNIRAELRGWSAPKDGNSIVDAPAAACEPRARGYNPAVLGHNVGAASTSERGHMPSSNEHNNDGVAAAPLPRPDRDREVDPDDQGVEDAPIPRPDRDSRG